MGSLRQREGWGRGDDEIVLSPTSTESHPAVTMIRDVIAGLTFTDGTRIEKTAAWSEANPHLLTVPHALHARPLESIKLRWKQSEQTILFQRL